MWGRELIWPDSNAFPANHYSTRVISLLSRLNLKTSIFAPEKMLVGRQAFPVGAKGMFFRGFKWLFVFFWRVVFLESMNHSLSSRLSKIIKDHWPQKFNTSPLKRDHFCSEERRSRLVFQWWFGVGFQGQSRYEKSRFFSLTLPMFPEKKNMNFIFPAKYGIPKSSKG